MGQAFLQQYTAISDEVRVGIECRDEDDEGDVDDEDPPDPDDGTNCCLFLLILWLTQGWVKGISESLLDNMLQTLSIASFSCLMPNDEQNNKYDVTLRFA